MALPNPIPIKRSEFNKVLYNTEYNPSSREFQEQEAREQNLHGFTLRSQDAHDNTNTSQRIPIRTFCVTYNVTLYTIHI
jgi:hypothetical protein